MSMNASHINKSLLESFIISKRLNKQFLSVRTVYIALLQKSSFDVRHVGSELVVLLKIVHQSGKEEISSWSSSLWAACLEDQKEKNHQ